MGATGLEVLEHTVHLTHSWINDLDGRLGWDNKPRCYRLLRSVLRAVRDWLQVNEAVDLAAQMPVLLRGVYFEQWRPAAAPVKQRGKADFLARIEQSFVADPLEHPEQAVMAVFELLSDKISVGEIADVRQSLPLDLRNLWPEHYVTVGDVRS